MEEIKKILKEGSMADRRALFEFGPNDSIEKVVLKFNLWSRYFFPKFFQSEDAPFHEDIDIFNTKVYLGEIKSFTDIIFRGGAKTTRTKLFFAFAIANDMDHNRRYLKVLTKDLTNSKQSVTDIYNMLADPLVVSHYPEIFKKTHYKREETMASFTTSTGIKLTADTVGSDQRGQLQEEARPDVIWFDDFETRKTLRSAVETKAIWDNMEEARTGLAKDGGSIYTCNYISEAGNVHKLVQKANDLNIVMNVPIIKKGKPTWPARYSVADIEQIRKDADDFAGEYLGEPSAGMDIVFDREMVDRQKETEPIKEIAGFRIYRQYNPSHRYAGGADVGGGVGLDSSTSCFINFDVIPNEVAATYDNKEIKPDIFGDELARQGEKFGECLLAPEKNNHGHATIGRLKQIYPVDKIYRTESKDSKIKLKPGLEYGWQTTGVTKPKMMFDLVKAVDDGLLLLNDPKLKAEARSYTRNDLMDAEVDPRLATRHFDLLTACAIAWQMRHHKPPTKNERQKLYFNIPGQNEPYRP